MMIVSAAPPFPLSIRLPPHPKVVTHTIAATTMRCLDFMELADSNKTPQRTNCL